MGVVCATDQVVHEVPNQTTQTTPERIQPKIIERILGQERSFGATLDVNFKGGIPQRANLGRELAAAAEHIEKNLMSTTRGLGKLPFQTLAQGNAANCSRKRGGSNRRGSCGSPAMRAAKAADVTGRPQRTASFATRRSSDATTSNNVARCCSILLARVKCRLDSFARWD